MADYLYGINPIHEALQGRGRKPLELLVVNGEPNDRLEGLISQAEQQRLKINYFARQELDRLAGHSHHQGVLLLLTSFRYTDFAELLRDWRASQQVAFFLLLDGITDPHNFGAILRSAEVAGCRAVIVAKDRSCPVTSVVEKTAAGALAHLPLCQVTNLSRTLDELKSAGVWCYGLAGEAEAQNLFSTDLQGNLALVVGSEGKGLRPNIRNHCDALLTIPMLGKINSLNASVATGIALFEVVRQNSQ
ncbi:MAG: 23S rRNA (guanosine(2251)-2'-O)-methyltransferase RlmB [Desulfuromusa sp.]|nr:23S rRNA (guanosine(2251)-2'-O)-methyltransferase RlmB [Desulfuromusa sp.]